MGKRAGFCLFTVWTTLACALMLAACSPQAPEPLRPESISSGVPAPSSLPSTATVLVTPETPSSLSAPVPSRAVSPGASPGVTPSGTQVAAPTDSLRSTPPRTPYRAAAVAPDGMCYLLDGSGRIHRLSPDTLAADSASPPLFHWADPGPSHLVVDDTFIVVSSPAYTRTLVLERESFTLRGELEQAGPVALDGNQRLFQVAREAAWAYQLADLEKPAIAVTEWPVGPFTPRPSNLAIDHEGRTLLVTLHDISASPPHQQESYAAYDLRSLQFLRFFPSQLGSLTRPSVAPHAGLIVGGMAAKNGFLGSKIAVFDRRGREVVAAQPIYGTPTIDARGDWVYVLTERGTWVLAAADLTPLAMEPYTGAPPFGLLLSPDGETLYSVWDDSLSVQQTAAIRAAGMAPLIGPIPEGWWDPARGEWFQARFFPAQDEPGTAFVQVGGYGETYRTTNAGSSWELLPGLLYPTFRYATHLSISPEFAQDRTLVAFTSSQPAFVRSTDAGETWTGWDPPVAFVSERDGDREIYTAGRGKVGGGPAQDIQRRTAHPAADENPAWSPAWTRIAFQSNRNGNWDIFTIRTDCEPEGNGGESACDQQQITDDPGDDTLPAWSPDGRWILFVSTRNGVPHIYVVGAQGGEARQLTDGATGDWRPAWWTDSENFVFGGEEEGDADILGSFLPGADAVESFMPESHLVVREPGFNREAAVSREGVLYLSDTAGTPRTKILYTSYPGATPSAVTIGTEAEGHPSPLDDGTGAVLVTLVRDGQTGTYRATYASYEPFVVGSSFNGHPAAGPVAWEPSPAWSAQAYRRFSQR